jgi:hypothetical protein
VTGYVKIKLPRSYPALIEIADGFIGCENATVADWRNDQRIARKEGRLQRPGVASMIRLAKAFDIPDNEKLLPRLKVLVAANKAVQELRPSEERAT